MKQRQKILIVDDRIENLIVLEEVLSNLDVEIFRATSGNEALSLALKHDFAVALLDVMMPEMDGYELAELLRGDAKTQVMPIVFLTASYYDEKHMFMGYEAGGVDYIMKPYAPDVLLSKVKIFLELNKHRKHLEELVAHRTKRLSHISEVLRAIRDVNQLIVKEKNVHALIQKSCDLLVGSRGMEGAWIILTDEDQDDIIEAHKGFVESVFSDFVEVFRNHNLPHCCRLAREKKRVIAARNFSEGCSTCPLKEFYSTKGVLISELVHKDQSYGFISVTLPPEYIEDAEEISLFDEITGDIAFALHGIKTEKKRHELNALFRQSFEMASIGKTLIDPDRCMKLVNRALADLLEYPREELENLCLDDIVHPDDLSENNEHIRCLLAGERLKCRMEERLVRKDKQVIWADVNMALMRNRAGEPLFLITHVLDITDRKRTDEALRQSHKIINLSPAVAFLWKNDEGWPVEYVSDNVVELFGYSAEEFINGEVSYGKIIYPDDLDRVGKEVDDYSKKDGTENFVHKPYRIITKDGDVRWVDDRTTILRNKDGIITHY